MKATNQQLADVRVAAESSGNQLWFLLKDLVDRYEVETSLTHESPRNVIVGFLCKVISCNPEFLDKSYLGSRVGNLVSARARIKWTAENTIHKFEVLPEGLKQYFIKHANRYASNGLVGNYSHKPEEKTRDKLHSNGQYFELVEYEQGLGFVANACIWITLTNVREHEGGWILTGYGLGSPGNSTIYVYPEGEKVDMEYVHGTWLPSSILRDLDA